MQANDCVKHALQGLALAAVFSAAADAWAAELWQVNTWDPPFDYAGQEQLTTYAPLQKARKAWQICAAYPHLKDLYWLSVNYGMVEQARRVGVGLQVVEAGGYPNLERQITQIKECAETADAVIVGAVSYTGLTSTIREIAMKKPVIAAVNDIANEGITAKAGVSWTMMGRTIADYFANRHPKGSKPVKIAWFPGPKGAGWVSFVESGFRAGMANSSASIVAVKWGDTGFEAQLLLLEEVLEEHPDIDYVIGSAVTADAAVSLFKSRNLQGKISILSDYFTHGTYRAIKRGKVIAAPNDQPVMQGRIAIDQTVRALEGQLQTVHAGPAIQIVDQSNVSSLTIEDSLAPAWFKPTFEVK